MEGTHENVLTCRVGKETLLGRGGEGRGGGQITTGNSMHQACTCLWALSEGRAALVLRVVRSLFLL